MIVAAPQAAAMVFDDADMILIPDQAAEPLCGFDSACRRDATDRCEMIAIGRGTMRR
jgi:hypothetical protein